MPQKRTDWDELLLQASDQIKERSLAPDIKKYRPHDKQYIFHKSNKSRKLYIGGNRSGKTTGGVCEGVWRSTKTHPYRPELNAIIGPVRGRVVAVDINKGIDLIIIPQYKQWTPPSVLRGGSWRTAYDSGARVLNFVNGSTIEFMSYEQDLDKFAGTSRHWIHFDEEPPRPIWVECLARLVDTNGEFWITMTPVEGMTWIYDDLFEKSAVIDPETGAVSTLPDAKVEIIAINTFENPYLTEEGIQNLVDVIDEDDITARIGGGFVTVGGRIYKNFNETPGAAQVLLEPIDDPKITFPERQWIWVMGLDHGLNNPTAVLWVAFDPNGFGVVFDEYYYSERTIEQNAMGIKEIIAKHGRAPDIMVADPSIKNRSPVSKLSIQQEYQKYGLNFRLGNNDVEAGIVRVKKYFNKAPYISSGHSRPEFFGGPKPGTNLDLWKPPTGEANMVYRLQISPACIKTRWEHKRYRWQTYTNKKLAFERNAYEVPNKKDDHTCDTLRYIIMNRPDMQSTNLRATKEDVDAAMQRIDRKLTMAMGPGGRYDDPNNLLEQGYDPFVDNAPSPVGEWTFDEHMGNIL